MATREIRLFEIVCDRCKSTERYESPGWQRIPAGWVRRHHPGYGSEGYAADEDVCPQCVAKETAE